MVMIKKSSFIHFSLLGIILVLLEFHHGQSRIVPLNKTTTADTSSFAPNTTENWGIVSSYLNQDTPDSVEFELILKKNTFTNWSAEHYIGSITNSQFIPARSQTVTYNLLSDNQWNLRVDTVGKCYLYQVNGGSLLASSLPGNPYVLPIRIRFKNN